MRCFHSFVPAILTVAVLLAGGPGSSAESDSTGPADRAAEIWERIAPFFQPPPELADQFGSYRSPLTFYDGQPVRTANDWTRRRDEILQRWHELMGPWPDVIEQPEVEQLDAERRDNFTQYRVRFQLAPGHPTSGYLLVPDGQGKRPAVVVVYYEPETGIGQKGEDRDFAYQLARRGFVTLSIGIGASLYYPNREAAELQPLSALAYGAANAYHVLAGRDEVDAQRIGIVGHSYGGKWAMFASCLYERFACAVWSDGGIVFDERRPNVNYWEPWYLGYEGPEFRRRGVPSEDRPRTGAYKRMMAEGYDLHELHALMAPRPFLVSGGSEDPPQRWQALNHSVAVNRLLGYSRRVAMTNRPGHSPTPESNEQMYRFFEWFLKHGGLEQK
jgi:hypothetical protein